MCLTPVCAQVVQILCNVNAFINQLHGEGVAGIVKSFCPSRKKCYFGGQLGDKLGEKRKIWKLKNKNLQIRAQFLMFEIKRIMGYICRWYAFLCKKSLSHAEVCKYICENLVGDDTTMGGDVGKVV